MRWLYISPHFDDAVLSCGGLVYEQARQAGAVEIWTICAGDPPPGPLSEFARKTHQDWDTGNAAETVTLRRKEDAAAAAIVGAKTRHFGIPDCIYRRSPEGDPLYVENVFAPLDPLEAGLDREIAAALERKLRPGDVLVCPLGVGGHLDHRLTRAAVELLGRPAWYYADIPYLLDHPEALEPVVHGLVEAKPFPVSESGLAAWQAGCAAYKSQLLGLFPNEEQMRAAIRSYCMDKGGVRLWRVL